MKNKLSIIIAHYYPNTTDYKNPLVRILDSINQDYIKNQNLEVIIADDGSHYSKSIVNTYSKKIDNSNISNQQGSYKIPINILLEKIKNI